MSSARPIARLPGITRVSPTCSRLQNSFGPEPRLFFTEDVPVEAKAVEELREFLQIGQTLERLIREAPGFFGDTSPEIKQVSVTPDFHKGSGVPIGTVLSTRGFIVPKAIGNDVNCGMRVHLTDLTLDNLEPHLEQLEHKLRHLYFQGGRDIPMTRKQRQALFTEGLSGLLQSVPPSQTEGLWKLFHQSDLERDLQRVHSQGSLRARTVRGLDDFLGPPSGLSRDAQIGSIGGGNHFVEFQCVENILDGTTAHAWGLKEKQILIMVHTGSVMIGHLCGQHARQVVKELYPPQLSHPSNGVYLLPTDGPHRETVERFRDSLHNAANFAFANRMFLALIAHQALLSACGEVESSLLYDAPHNLVWEEEDESFLHRKGACPARGLEAMVGTPFEYYGEPVMVPGSMGSSSFLLAGLGNKEALSSASHGAGRKLSRGQALRLDDRAFEEFLAHFRVVTPVDFQDPALRLRPDILEEKLADIKKEAPFAYKGIGPVIDTLERAEIARPVAELRPLLTVKG